MAQAQTRRIEICEQRLFWEWDQDFATLSFSLIESTSSGRNYNLNIDLTGSIDIKVYNNKGI